MTGRVALVTGGATGIGAAITGRLLADGYHVLAVQRTEREASEGRRALASDRAYVAAHDLAGADGPRAAVAECVARFGGLDVLVNNAAVTGRPAVAPLDALDDARIDRIIDTNLKAPLRLAREALPHLAERGGVIVNVGSIAAFQAQPDAAAYVASKAGLAGLTRALAYDLAPRGIRVVHLAPGAVDTEASLDPAYTRERRDAGWSKPTPLGRAAAPHQVAEAVAWLVSDGAGPVTGSTLFVDGGLSAF
ncbi:SDR family NAD(P)-dependent oxidoreductase [Phytohabitans kaempferiae]|uniref:SDR family NAD(P)-dependent oxidoreductase n=1 Tax=Phytohabitans kaempferiae TaxID=1620943 RepID=A0ABV6M6J1_9ACTN